MFTFQLDKISNLCLSYILPLQLIRCTFALGKSFVFRVCLLDPMCNGRGIPFVTALCASTLIEISMQGRGGMEHKKNVGLEPIVMTQMTFCMFPLPLS